MDPLLIYVRYLLDRAACRARAALDGDPESGALTLEWIVIASIVAVAAVAAGVIFQKEIAKFTKKLP